MTNEIGYEIDFLVVGDGERSGDAISVRYGKAFCEEKELRISLSALGMGHFRLNDGSFMELRSSLQIPFDFRAATADRTIERVLCAPDADGDFLKNELYKMRIVPK